MNLRGSYNERAGEVPDAKESGHRLTLSYQQKNSDETFGFALDWWHVLRIDGVPSGVLLFNRGADGHSIELVYLGLVPMARGRGLGKTLLTFGLAALDGDGARIVVLAVDRENQPAVRLYRRAGFRHSVRRTAMVHPLAP
ncbi:MAG: GNAT family N-acetyltransferase [Planctomycetia bacterium]|nr:GNAT family N-acetyltransferase [Planctomycetia bacterium]